MTLALALCQTMNLVLPPSWAVILTLGPAQVVNSAPAQYWAAILAQLHLGLQLLLLPISGQYLGSSPVLATTSALAAYHAVSSTPAPALALSQVTTSAPG